MKKKIIIAGISGLIGKQLAEFLIQKGYEIVGLSRNPGKHKDLEAKGIKIIKWNGSCPDPWIEEMDHSLAVINLSGASIGIGKWTEKKKTKILKSRISAIHAISDGIRIIDHPPKYFLQASAIGYYGNQITDEVDEEGNPGTGFLSDVCQKIEAETNAIEESIPRLLRFGLVLSTKGGALPPLTLSMKFGMGVIPGSGKNFISWIHIDDICKAILHILENEQKNDVFNLVSPEPITMKTLLKTIRQKRKIPFLIPAPSPLIKMIIGKEKTEESILADQKVLPKNLTESGYKFSYPTISEAVENLYR